MAAAKRRVVAAAIGVAILIILLFVGGLVLLLWQTDETTVTAPRIKVGVILAQNAGGDETYGWLAKAFREGLGHPDLELFPVIETGTAKHAGIATACREFFGGKSPIEGTDEQQMRTLQVFVTLNVVEMPSQMIDAVEKLVRDEGKGLLIRSFAGVWLDRYTPQMMALNGLKDGQWGWNGQNQPCEVVAAHPILGDLPVGTQLMLEPNGAFGVHNGQVLVRMTSAGSVDPAPRRAEFVVAPVYVAELGKGKIVGGCFLGYQNTPQTMHLVNGLTVRGIKWLANQPQ